MGDDRRRHQRHEAMDREQSGCQVLGLGRVGSEAGFDHVAQDGDDEAIEEGFCLGRVSMSGITGNCVSLPENKPSVEVKIDRPLDERHLWPQARYSAAIMDYCAVPAIMEKLKEVCAHPSGR